MLSFKLCPQKKRERETFLSHSTLDNDLPMRLHSRRQAVPCCPLSCMRALLRLWDVTLRCGAPENVAHMYSTYPVLPRDAGLDVCDGRRSANPPYPYMIILLAPAGKSLRARSGSYTKSSHSGLLPRLRLGRSAPITSSRAEFCASGSSPAAASMPAGADGTDERR